MYESKGKASPILYSYLVDGVTISINRYHVGAVGLFGGSTMNKIKYHGGIGSLNVPLSIEHYVSPGRLLLGSSWLLFFKVNKTKKKAFIISCKGKLWKKESFSYLENPFWQQNTSLFSPFHQSDGKSAFDHCVSTIKSPERKSALVAEEIIHWLYKIWTELLGAETWSLHSLQWPSSSSLVSSLLHFSMMFIL